MVSGFAQIQRLLAPAFKTQQQQAGGKKPTPAASKQRCKPSTLGADIDAITTGMDLHSHTIAEHGWEALLTSDPAAAMTLQTEFSLFASDAAVFLAAAAGLLRQQVPPHANMHHQGSTAARSQWIDVVSICRAFSSWSRTWPLDTLHVNVALHAAFDALLCWVLDVQQSLPGDRFAFAVTSSHEEWTQQLLVVMQAPPLCFTYDTITEERAPETHNLVFNSGVVTALFCLAGDILRAETALLGPKPEPGWDSTAADCMNSILLALIRFLPGEPGGPAWARVCSGPLRPCILEAIKLLLLAYVVHDPEEWHAEIGPPSLYLHMLCSFGLRYGGQPIATPGAPNQKALGASRSSQGGSSSRNGLHAHKKSDGMPRVSTHDEALLHALKLISMRDPANLDMVNESIHGGGELHWGEPSSLGLPSPGVSAGSQQRHRHGQAAHTRRDVEEKAALMRSPALLLLKWKMMPGSLRFM
ncbi:MAG: hypothetical protein WDW38_010575 [Sanguina aurantia]